MKIPVLLELRHSAAASLRTPGSSAAVLLPVGGAVAVLLTVDCPGPARRAAALDPLATSRHE